MKDQKSPVPTIKLLQNVAFVSALFAVLLCVLIIVNFIQLKRADPLNTAAMNTLIERLKSNPDDDQLRSEIRTLDLLARKAFFTNQWQVRAGGYLLFISILLVIASLKTIDFLRKKLPDEPSARADNFWEKRKINRKWVAFSGGVLVVTSLILVVFTHNDLGKNLDDAAFSRSASADSTKTQSDNDQPRAGQQDSLQIAAPSGTDSSSKTAPVALEGYPSWQEIISNFTTFRGPGSIGIAFQKNIPTSWDGKSGKNIRWKTEIPLPGFNSPVVWNDRIFLSGANESKREVYGIDINTGKILWRTEVEKIPGSPSKAPSVHKETGQSAPTLTTDGRRVYAIFANGDLIALDMDGNKVWDKNLGVPVNHYGHSSSLIMYHDLLIIQYDQRNSAAIMALSGKTGETIWKTNRNVKVSWASPSLINTGKRSEIILAAEPYVAGYNPVNGKELWKFDCISGEVGPSIAYADGVVFSVNEYSKLAAVQIGETPKLLWEDTEYLSDVPSPVATDKYLFLVTSYGTMVCYDAKAGTKYWEHEFGNATYASPMLVEGKIYLLDKRGVMNIVKADKDFSLIGESALGEGSFCTPAFANGHLFIRGDKNLYCIGK